VCPCLYCGRLYKPEDVNPPRGGRSHPEQVLRPHAIFPNKLDGDAKKVMPLDEYNRERSPIRTAVLVDTTQHCFFCELPGRQLMIVQCVRVAENEGTHAYNRGIRYDVQTQNNAIVNSSNATGRTHGRSLH